MDWKAQYCYGVSSSQLDLQVIQTNYRFSVIPVKILASFFVDIDKPILKFTWKGKRYTIASTLLKKNRVGGLILPDFKTL